MSIIYDALKKVQKIHTLDPAPKIDKTKKNKYKTYLFYVVTLCFGFFIANTFFSFINRNISESKIKSTALTQPINSASRQDITKEEPGGLKQEASTIQHKTPSSLGKTTKIEDSLTLNGVFFSEEQGYALINNQILQEGDTIAGAVIKRITLEGVELEAQGSSFKLANKSK